MKRLSDVSHPSDLKQFTTHELSSLGIEIRQRITDVLSKTGGHLSSNLGIVELSIALHRVFNSPVDKLIFDVSHQTYTHKILTGRNTLLETLRQFKGLSGFSHPQESVHDHFYAGHAGTAISLALGAAKSRDLLHHEEHVIPIIGDAALTCGLTLEALNNIPKDLKRFIIILNDNGMSISKNVGAITQILSELDSPALFFEQFGLSYVGPIDGYDMETLLSTLEKVKNQNKPILLHVLTVKGKGMNRATEQPTTYHGVKPFDKMTGKFHPDTPTPTFPKVFGEHLLHMAKQDPYLVAITPAMPAGSCLTPFMEKYPDRCLDVGIAEGHAITFAGGIAANRQMKVVASVYSTFLQRALDNVFHDICLQHIPLVIALDRAGIAGADGSTHNGLYDIGFLNGMPNMVICQPRNGNVLKELLESAFSYHLPTTIRYPNLPCTLTEEPLELRPLGRGEIIARGEEVVIVALGHKITTALEVNALLNLNATIIDPVFLKPLDTDLFLEIFSTHKLLITIEEHSLQTGLASILNSFILQHHLSHIQVLNFGVPEMFIEHGKHAELSRECGLDAESIAYKIHQEIPCHDYCHPTESIQSSCP